jgi:hypothetical protein
MMSARWRSLPVGAFVVLALAVLLYALMLINILAPDTSGPGDRVVGEAFMELFITVGLWVVLAILVVIGGVMGAMPRWVGWSAVVLVPLAGVASFVALDMVSRGVMAGIIVPVLLPALVAFYAMWARMKQLRGRFPAGWISVAVWGLIAVISIVALVSAAYY